MARQSPAERLRAFVSRFVERSDVRVDTLRLGDPAPPEALAPLRGNIPTELFEFYAAMNGARVEWAFVEPPGGGCLAIPPVSDWTRFATDDEQNTHFGPDRRAMLLDALQPECATWYVLAEGRSVDDAVLWFSGSASTGDGKVVARSLGEYIDLAIEHAFVWWWPLRSFPDAIERASARPVEPAALRPGARVHSSHYSEGARGVVRELRTVDNGAARHRELFGDTFARVALDDGDERWISTRWVKAARRADEYEDAVARGPAWWAELCSRPIPDRLAALARAIGPVQGYSPTWGGPSNARRASGMLSPLSIAAAIDLVARAFGDAGRLMKGGVPLLEERSLERSEREFDGGEWRDRKHRFVPAAVLEGLIAGLARRIGRESAATGLPPAAVAGDASARLRNIAGFAMWLQPVLASASAIEPPSPSADEVRLRDELGLPGPSGLALGTGA
jgi:hypothetical protein